MTGECPTPTKKQRREQRRQEKQQRLIQSQRRQNARRVGRWLLIILLIAGAVGGVVKLANSPSSSSQTASLTEAVSDKDWVGGDREARLTLVEYADLQCPACAAYQPMLQQLAQEYGQQMGFVFRHFPLRQIHQNAVPAAYAVEAAGRQGKFWEMLDLIFKNQARWSKQPDAEQIFTNYARELKLDLDRFERDRQAAAVKEKVAKDYQGGLASGVNATPTFFLAGRKIKNPRSYAEFNRLIEQALNSDR